MSDPPYFFFVFWSKMGLIRTGIESPGFLLPSLLRPGWGRAALYYQFEWAVLGGVHTFRMCVRVTAFWGHLQNSSRQIVVTLCHFKAGLFRM